MPRWHQRACLGKEQEQQTVDEGDCLLECEAIRVNGPRASRSGGIECRRQCCQRLDDAAAEGGADIEPVRL